MTLNTVDEILADIRAGRMVVLIDDEDRENEGDLLMAAQAVRPEDVNFMAKHGRGLICLTLTSGRCKQLRLPLMTTPNDNRDTTGFTVSIEAAEGVTTGISAHDRARTILAAASPDAKPEDLRQPGHVFPVMAREGGVLFRAGHTEAGCDLARLAGFEPAAMIVEIMNDDGTMARRPDLEKFAAQHGLKIGTIADLIRFRLEREQLVERIDERDVATDFGSFRLLCYEDRVNFTVHLALVRGELGGQQTPLVRVQVAETLRDTVGVRSGALGWPLRSAMQKVADHGNGVVVLLRYEESARELIESVHSLRSTQSRSEPATAAARVLRTHGIAAQILRDLGVSRMRVLAAPKLTQGLAGFGLEVTEYVTD
jgi:3,4-dihydroxy 2-butanone 4-phosphate synthase / GTP cyclohydrolase II